MKGAPLGFLGVDKKMKGTTKVTFEVGGVSMYFETGVLAKQADAAVICGLEENLVFSAVTSANEAREGCDFFPLQVEYREKFYAAGRFPGDTSNAKRVHLRKKFYDACNRPSDSDALSL